MQKDLFVSINKTVNLVEVIEPIAIECAHSLTNHLNLSGRWTEIKNIVLTELLKFDWENSGIQTLSTTPNAPKAR